VLQKEEDVILGGFILLKASVSPPVSFGILCGEGGIGSWVSLLTFTLGHAAQEDDAPGPPQYTSA
jgi:hypothetical protein